MVATVETGSLTGVDAVGVTVEVSEARGLPRLEIIGLPEAALRESCVRVTAALANSHYTLPERHFIVNLAPADLRKSGASFDLAIAIALLATCGMCAPTLLPDTLLIGELSLDGRVRSVRGVLAHLRSARARGLRNAIVPEADGAWAALVSGLDVRAAGHLREVVAFLEGLEPLPRARMQDAPDQLPRTFDDLRDVCGQDAAKRALEVAAAGGHNVLMVGPPGAGKTMLARRLPGLLPEPSSEEALEIATIASVGGVGHPLQGITRPFRAPHHSCSEAALVGGGSPVRPGEVTLAHGGVLFLDELPEFNRSAIEGLRPTMESGVAMIVRTRERVMMPARPLVIAAMNPCPCGYAGDKKRMCRCTFEQAQRYLGRLSGPMIDRFDIHLQLPPVAVDALENDARGDPSELVRARVCAARSCMLERRLGSGPRRTRALAKQLAPNARRLLLQSLEMLGLSLRAYSKILRVARTIADLEGSDGIAGSHVAEAIQYRLLDRNPQAPATPIVRGGLVSM